MILRECMTMEKNSSSYKKKSPSSKLIHRFKLAKGGSLHKEDLTLDNFYNEHLENIKEATKEHENKDIEKVIESENELVVMYNRLLQTSNIRSKDGLERRRICRHIYFRICDSALSILDIIPLDHYQTKLTLAAIDACEPESPNFLDWVTLIPLLALYDMETKDLQKQCTQAKALVKCSKKNSYMKCAIQEVKSAKLWKVVELMELAMTFPSTMAELKRSIYCLKIITDIVTDKQKDHLHKEEEYEHCGSKYINSSFLYLDQLPNGLFLKCNNPKLETIQMNKRFKTFSLKNRNGSITNEKAEKCNKIPLDVRDWIFETVLSKYTSVN